jgi:hypothetical protein
MTLIIDIKDSVADKILYFLNHFQDDVKVIKKESGFESDMMLSKKDLEDGNIEEITDVDSYINELADEIK